MRPRKTRRLEAWGDLAAGRERRATWSLVVLFAGALLGLGVAGCGGAGNTSRSSGTSASSVAAKPETGTITSSAIPPGQRLRGDGDADNPSDIDGNGDVDADQDNDYPVPASYKLPDEDDKSTLAYGRPASAADSRAIASAVERYYAAASADDGATACSLLSPGFARSVPEDYGRAPGPPYLRGGKTCQAVMSMLFEHLHEQLSEAVSVVQARVKGATAQAVFSSRRMPASDILLTRRARSWKVLSLIGQPLP